MTCLSIVKYSAVWDMYSQWRKSFWAEVQSSFRYLTITAEENDSSTSGAWTLKWASWVHMQALSYYLCENHFSCFFLPPPIFYMRLIIVRTPRIVMSIVRGEYSSMRCVWAALTHCLVVFVCFVEIEECYFAAGHEIAINVWHKHWDSFVMFWWMLFKSWQLFVFFETRFPLCSSGCPGAHCVD